ncbi:subtilisin-like protease SBT4.3 [Impatiens glandulifera]|uniref:subtilisin-like protease SBT4.3 n=1 Tax=Impatiens glandulifera TaxID=253017 RepID=UPI001FB0F87B|nr:subtilisin-like protease SBT4.3 [Impatiens glandulifera]
MVLMSQALGSDLRALTIVSLLSYFFPRSESSFTTLVKQSLNSFILDDCLPYFLCNGASSDLGKCVSVQGSVDSISIDIVKIVPSSVLICQFSPFLVDLYWTIREDEHHFIVHGGQEYIVYLGDLKQESDIPLPVLHSNFLKKAFGGLNNTYTSLLHTYKADFNGFVAMLTKDEYHRISLMKEVVSIFPNRNNYLYTTRSWDFIGFHETSRRVLSVESDIIVGIIDTGIWPELNNFRDTGLGPPPHKWKGSCRGLINFTCNNKIIGARYYNRKGDFTETDIKSPRDTNGHGTHIASTIAGNPISSASFSGLGKGTARGGVPSSRIAVYKVCWSNNICADADILAAFDDAIKDGVDIISISNGNDYNANYLDDSIAIGSFLAMGKGILTTMAGGNDGPEISTVTNVAPWAITVAASTIDRRFFTKLKLGNHATFQGDTVNTFDSNGFLPLVYGGDVPNKTLNISGAVSRFCQINSLDAKLVKGKIVLCDQLNSGAGALSAGATGMVIRANGPKDNALVFPLPATYVDDKVGHDIMNYINTTRNPIASILKSNEAIDEFAPYIAFMSSRGPNTLTYSILKPDLCAPGIGILGAWTKGVQIDKRRLPYNVLSGTSIATPHVAAAAAYVKSFNPSWSPSAIKSALMTTAFMMNANTSSGQEFGYGAGQINPVGAIDPGLVYDASKEDYLQLLCSLKYDSKQLKKLTNDVIPCSCIFLGCKTAWNLNLPSFYKNVFLSTPFNVTFTRRVTNVGSASSIYNAQIVAPPALKIVVVPNKLFFSSVGQTRSFRMTVTGRLSSKQKFVSASLSWVDATHIVRSPIVIFAPR